MIWTTEHTLPSKMRAVFALRFSCRTLGKIFSIIVITIISAYSLLYLTTSISSTPLRKNISKAYSEGYFVSNYPEYPVLTQIGKKLDMFTECVGLSIAVQSEPKLSNLLRANAYGECRALSEAVTRNFEQESFPYARYTHGYQIVLKPLYSLFEIELVRVITAATSMSLLLALFFVLKGNVGTLDASVVVLTFLLVRSPHVLVLVTHAVQFWVVLAASMAVVLLRNKTSPYYVFAAIGAIDGFVSFLNMGSLSLSLPLLCFVLATWRDGKKSELIIAAAFWSSLAWSLGFLAPWLTKWTLLLANGFSLDEIFGHTLKAYPASDYNMIIKAVRNNIEASRWRAWVIIFGLMLALKFTLKAKTPNGLWVVLFPSAVPLIWICLLPGQSGVIHEQFINIIIWPILASGALLLVPRKNLTRGYFKFGRPGHE